MKKVLFVSNSQGAASGLQLDEIYASYPHLVQGELPEINCIFWNRSYLNVTEVNDSFSEIILNHKPDVVFLQCGIIEAGMRILPKRLRDVLRGVYGGKIITNYLHKHQVAWRRLLSKFNIAFTDFTLKEFRDALNGIIQQCSKHQIEIVVIITPLLSVQCDEEFLHGNNQVIEKYNSVMTDVCRENRIRYIVPQFERFDPTRNSLYISNSVHFSKDGHKLIAQQLVNFIKTELLGKNGN